MADCARFLANIDRRIAYISAQVELGADHDEVVTEQHKAPLLECSQLRCVDVAMTTRIINHVLAHGVFSRPQLLALNASLRAAISATPGTSTRRMQTVDALEHCLLKLE